MICDSNIELCASLECHWWLSNRLSHWKIVVPCYSAPQVIGVDVPQHILMSI
jgi:hypothetical protein